MTLKRSLLAGTCFVLPMLAIGVQDAAAQLEEIVVTAERRQATLQSVPVAVSAFSVETLENRQIAKAQDLQRTVPSLKMNNNITTPNNLSPSLRGSSVQDASLVVAESPFGIYLDDVYIGRLNANNVELADVERIEVLRGPQGTLYGRNTLAGAIKFISRTPGEDPWLNANIGYGNAGQYKAGASVGGPLSDNVAASFAAQFSGLDGHYTDVATGKDLGAEDNFAARGKARLFDLDGFEAMVTLSYSVTDNDALQLVPGFTPNVPADQQFESDDIAFVFGPYDRNVPTNAPGTPFAEEPTGHTEQFIVSLDMSYEFDAGTLRSITAYVNTDDEWYNNFAGGNPPGAFRLAGFNTSDTQQFTQEFLFTGDAYNERLSYTVGAYYLYEDAEQELRWQAGLIPNAPLLALSRDPISSTVQSVSLFGQFDYDITDSLKATIGGRWLQDDKDFEGQVFSFLGAPPSRIQRFDETFNAFTPKFGLSYEIEDAGAIDTMLLYGTASRGFKSGGFSAILVGNINDSSSYDPETNWTYELGMKADFLDSRLRVNAALFWNEVEDVQLNSTSIRPDGTTGFPVQNAGDTTIKGLELEISANPFEGLDVFMNAAFLDGEFDRLDPGSQAALAPTLFNIAEPEVPQVPDYTIGVGFNYRHDFTMQGRDSNFSFGLDWFISSDYTLASTNDFRISEYDRLNGYVALGLDDKWELRLSGKNLTDETTIVSGSRSLGGLILLPPREVFLSLSYRM